MKDIVRYKLPIHHSEYICIGWQAPIQSICVHYLDRPWLTNMTFRYASISCTDNSILPIFCHDLVKCITAYIQLSKHLKGQLGPPLSHVTFFGPKEVSWRLGAPLSHITFFGSSEVSWAPSWVISLFFFNQRRSVRAPCESALASYM